jgi:hypothetical protein
MYGKRVRTAQGHKQVNSKLENVFLTVTDFEEVSIRLQCRPRLHVYTVDPPIDDTPNKGKILCIKDTL